MRNISIRMRLTMWYSGVLAALLAAFGAVVYFTMCHQALSRIDHGLREEMSDVLSEVDRAVNRVDMLQWLDRRFGNHQGFDFQITAADGSRVFVNKRLGEQQMPIPSSLVLNQDICENHQRANEPRWRIVTRKVNGPEAALVVQIARSLEFHDHEMRELLVALLVTGPLTLLIALGGGYFLARHSLSPVDRMTETANRIEAKQLGSRLEVVNSDDELGRLAMTLNGMLERLERSFREMQRFTADASHELRTPISVIRTEVEVALNKPVAEDLQNLLGSILEECERLTCITDQLLMLSREDAGISHSRQEVVNLTEVASDVAKTMKPLADGRNVTLSAVTNGEVVVTGDEDRLKQVVYNLLDNAIKYTQEGGSVEVTVEDGNDGVSLSVRDTGIGIAPEHIPHVFARFYRVDKARTRAEGGTGLGLSIVESIATAHGGTVAIESEPGKGTTVTVSLPRQISQTREIELQ